MRNKMGILLPSAVILLCNMYFVFYGIDRVNPMMAFVDHNLTKALLLLMCVLSIACAAAVVRQERLRERARAHARRRGRSRRDGGRNA